MEQKMTNKEKKNQESSGEGSKTGVFSISSVYTGDKEVFVSKNWPG